MKYYLIAGEASGDLHGANLMRGLQKHDPDAQFRFWGGDGMAAVGGEENLARHYKTASFFGISEILLNLRTIFAQLKECKADVERFAPDVLILIDYPGFNFKMARFAHGRGIRTFYYISPKVWAWKEGRVKQIRRYVDKLFIIFPFEQDYFRERGIEAIYEGNPLVDSLEQHLAAMPPREAFLAGAGLTPAKPVVALLAGSRKSEIRYNLPFMTHLARRFPDHQFVVAGVSWLDRALYDRILAGSPVTYVEDATYPLLRYAEAAVVTSGTATLEAALLNTPEVVCYRSSRVTIWVGKMLVKAPFISLVNLIMGREVVRELIQEQMTQNNAYLTLVSLLPGGSKRENMLRDFDELRRRIGGPGASDRFAARMVELLRAGERGEK